jgi:hypothetical protein
MGERGLLAKMPGMLGRARDGEALNAARQAEKIRRRLGVTWEELIRTTEAIRSRILDDAANA